MKLFVLVLTLLLIGCNGENQYNSATEANFWSIGEVSDDGQLVTGVVAEFPVEVDLDSIDKETFVVGVVGKPEVDLSEYGVEVNDDLFPDTMRAIEDITYFNGDKSKLLITFDYENEGDIAKTTRYIGDLSRNIIMEYDFAIGQEKDFKDLEGRAISIKSGYEYLGMKDALVDKFEGREEANMKYQFYAPADSESKKPLIVMLHGNGEGGFKGYQNNMTQLIANRGVTFLVEDENQATFGGAYVIAPQVKDTWYNVYDNGYLEELIQVIEKEVTNNNIDEERIYIGGLSAGGFMTWQTLIHNKDLFAGAISICPALDRAESATGAVTKKEDIETLKDFPVWMIHSENDSIVSVEDTSRWLYDILKGSGKAIYTEFPDTVIDGKEYFNHASWIYATNNIPEQNGEHMLEWLSKQSK